MKTVIGVDTGGHYKAALNLVARLKIEKPEWTLAHCVDITMPLGGYGISSEAALAFDFIKFANEIGEEALEKAQDDACSHGISAQTVLLTGNAATALVQYAEDHDVDLVCVHSERKGRLGSLFLGSVSRGLAIGSRHSILISKGLVSPNGRLNVVFASDQSDYADKSLDAFIAMGAKGIGSIHVVTALHLSEKSGHFDVAKLDSSIEKYLVETADKKMEESLAKLRKAGYTCTGQVVNLPVNEALAEAMKSNHADLLVMGAQGHGMMHRVLLGSTSLHQVVVEPHSVLIIRP